MSSPVRAKKSGNIFRVGIFLDRHGGEIERLTGDATVQSIMTFVFLEIIEQLSLNILTGETPKVTEVLSHFLTLGIVQVDLFTCF